MKRNSVFLFVMIAFTLSACATPMTQTQKGAAVGTGVGAATGALLGQAIGRDTTSTVLGAVAGAAAGGIAGGLIGNYMEKQERELQQALADAEGASVERQQNEILVTFKSDVLFDVDSARLKAGAYEDIDQVADILNRYPETRVRVSGFTDSTGSEEYNLQLSEDRALAVKDAIVDRGVAPKRIAARGFGESKPVASNATEAGRQLNRRVTIKIIPIEKGK
ncbi:MAG: OmpA family protein [Deltaproteobacteria bacterium]|uniref:OmpA family lipoprotein n=2 Tax=Desulforhabdus amnigena TaxID=40218 RepID=A0A9W6FTC0_9BACT|nr:OmpA family protein [Deltaproteobacteria bacterium]GLI32871.1 OmpA family lipoprotein [Desulforhabdus amnigena]